MHLDNRLSLIASFVRRGSRIADIGSDHAHLPIWLVGEQISPRVIATDINEGPASRAKATVKTANLEAKIEVRLGDGLSPVRPDEADDIIIAGMGGETIANILKSAPWTMAKQYHFILQPMTKQEILRAFLLTAGYAIQKECIAQTGSRMYPVLSVRFDPHTAAMQASRPAAFYRGALDPHKDRVYIQKQMDRLVKAAIALRGAGKSDQAEKLEGIADDMLK